MITAACWNSCVLPAVNWITTICVLPNFSLLFFYFSNCVCLHPACGESKTVGFLIKRPQSSVWMKQHFSISTLCHKQMNVAMLLNSPGWNAVMEITSEVEIWTHKHTRQVTTPSGPHWFNVQTGSCCVLVKSVFALIICSCELCDKWSFLIMLLTTWAPLQVGDDVLSSLKLPHTLLVSALNEAAVFKVGCKLRAF